MNVVVKQKNKRSLHIFLQANMETSFLVDSSSVYGGAYHTAFNSHTPA